MTSPKSQSGLNSRTGLNSRKALNRRRFLTATTGLAASVAVGSQLLDPSRAAATTIRDPRLAGPAKPTGHKAFVTRPDLRPPSVSITVSGNGDRHAPYIFLAPRVAPGGTMPTGALRGLMIIDRRGDLVWFHPMDSYGKDPFNLRVASYRGKPVMSWYQGIVSDEGIGAGGNYALMDDTYTMITTVEAKHYPSDLHEFHITDQGTALLSSYEPKTSDHPIISHAEEVDIATNDLILDWASYPRIPVSDSYSNPAGDYFHLNSIDLWPGSARDLLISARHTSTVYLINRKDHTVRWQVGGKNSSFTVGPNAVFSFQHDARPLADGSGISLFDNANNMAGAPSKGMVIRLNQSTKQASLVHSYQHSNGPSLRVNSQGNCQLLPSAGHFVGWGALPYFTEYGPSGDAVEAPIVLDGRFPDGVESYRAFMFDWVGNPPLSELKLVVRRHDSAGNSTAFVSWNGATEVGVWVIQAGTSSGSLTKVATADRTNFEQVIDFTKKGATAYRAVAYTKAGKQLGMSPVFSLD